MTLKVHAATARVAKADPAGLLYGAIISASVLATVSAHSDEVSNVVLAVTSVLGVYWLAHVYIAAVAHPFHGDDRHPLHRAATAAGHESPVLLGGVPAILVYMAGILAGLGPGAAAKMAVYFSVGLLVYVGYLAARKAGRTGTAALVDAGVGGLLGLVLVIAKALMH